jgi:hypothetical protein
LFRLRARASVRRPLRGKLVPDTAVLTDQDKKYLFLINDQNVVFRRDIKPGRLLEDGMRVVSAADKGQEIKPNNWVMLTVCNARASTTRRTDGQFRQADRPGQNH